MDQTDRQKPMPRMPKWQRFAVAYILALVAAVFIGIASHVMVLPPAVTAVAVVLIASAAIAWATQLFGTPGTR